MISTAKSVNSRMHLVESAGRVSELARENMLLSRALEAVQRGDLASAEKLLEASTDSKLTLHEVFGLYQAELQTRDEDLCQSQQRIEQSLDWFANLFRSLPVAAVLIDAPGMVVDANEYALEALGLQRVMGRLLLPLRRLLTSPEDELRWAEMLAKVAAGQAASLDEVALLTLQGNSLWVDMRANQVPPRTQDAAAPLMMCVFNDRTARVEAQRAREMAAQAEHQRDVALSASIAKTKLLSRVSHELRTPLNAVIGFSQLMLMEPGKLEADTQRKIQLISDAGHHLLSLVNEVLQINRAEAGQLVIHTKIVDLQALACDVLMLQEPMAQAMELALKMPLSQGPQPKIFAWGDPQRVREVLINLVANAIKYNRRGGSLELQVGCDESQAWIEVIDTGMGLSSEQLEHMFEPFNRLGAERSAPGVEGSGLGLSIAQSLTQAMGGTLKVNSAPGVGSNFTLLLPKA
jgi:PAS domain S-box-containing protein